MQTVCFKEHGGVFHNSVVQPIPLTSVPWRSGIGSQWVFGESFGQLKDHHTSGEKVLGGIHRQESRGMDQVAVKDNQNTAQFTIFPGDGKDAQKERKGQEAALSLQTGQPGYQTFELGLAQPMVCTNYPYIDQCYGVLATYGTHIKGRMMLPLNVKSDDGPIFVNAKQYHGILRRRQSRAKAELENKLIKVRKPYLHESRHLHALRRARGGGGRFLTKNEKKGTTKENSSERNHSPTSESTSSEVLQSESRNFNRSKDLYRMDSSFSSSEVTSMYSRGDIDRFHMDHFRASAFHSLSNMIDSGQGMNSSNRWVTAADGCCDLLKT